MVEGYGTYAILGIIFTVISIATASVLVYFEDMLATPLGKLGAFAFILLQVIVVGWIVVTVAGLKKDVKQVVGKVTWVRIRVLKVQLIERLPVPRPFMV
jgi:hypothetical protein